MSERGDESNVGQFHDHYPMSSDSPERLKYLCCFADGMKRTVKIETSTVEIEERGVKLRLTVVDTPGYGDGMDNKDRLEFFL